jgi:Kef-type K+ transport system membrane component KefB
MDPTTISVLVIGIIIVIGLIAKVIFNKFKIPDVLILISVGAILGYFNLAPSLSSDSGIMNVLLIFALIYIVFNGGLPISIKAIFSSAKWAFMSSLLNFFGISVIVGLITYAFGFNFKISLTAGILMCVMDGSIINSILENFKFSKRGEAFVQIESAIIDIFVIVGIVTLWVENLSLGNFSQQIVNFLIISLNMKLYAFLYTLTPATNISSI